MHIRTRVAAGTLAALAVAGCAAGTAAAQATPQAPGQLTFASQLTAIRFFTASGPITGFPTSPLVPGDRIIGQDRILQHGRTAGHDNEACTVSFDRDVLCQDIVILTGQGQELVDAALADLLRRERALLAGLDAGEREHLADLMRILLAPFDDVSRAPQ